MLERIWIHIQTYTIIALVNSPALLMLWTGLHPTEFIDHGPQSTAVQEAPIEIYSIHIEPEETSTIEEPSKEKIIAQKSPSKNPNVEKKIPTNTIKKSTPSKETPKLNFKISQNTHALHPSKQYIKQNQKNKRKKRTAQCSPRPNRRIHQISTYQFALQKKVVHRYLGNLDNIKGLAKAYLPPDPPRLWQSALQSWRA